LYGYGKTDKGKIRKGNEDSIFVSNDKIGPLPTLYIVADGMGGHNAGEVASNLSIKYFTEYALENNFDNDEFLDFIIGGTKFSNDKVFDDSKKNPAELYGMGTTFSLCVIDNDRLFISHVGDSRVYKINENEIIQLTQDHTYVNEMVRLGQITKEEAKTHPDKNKILRALGFQDIISIDGSSETIDKDDLILICSDGLSNMISDVDIKNIALNTENIEDAVNKLVDLANVNGGEDNISVILIRKKVGEEK